MLLPEIQNYTEYLFRIALKKCGNLNDAEDLTQEVLLCALQYPKDISDPKAWLSSVLNHKFYDMLRRKYRYPTISIEELPEDDEWCLSPETADRPDAAAVRRETAYLAEKYRTVIVRHYLYGEKVQDIADSLGVPKGTVLSRLSVGREQMKKGLESMEPYEKQSYQPERLDVSYHGRGGFHDEPWSLVEDNLLKQNILIAAYDEPRTAVEIARALGIPTAYIENALHELTASELMQKTGNRYFSDFMIVTPEQILKRLDAEISLTETHYPEILELVNAYRASLCAPEFLSRLSDIHRKKLVYYFILHLFSHAIYTALRRLVPSEEEHYPCRPDGGSWIAEGTRYPLVFDFEQYRFAKYCYGGERLSAEENFLGARSVHLRIYDTQPDLNRYERSPDGMRDETLVKFLYVLARGIPFESTGLDALYLRSVPHLISCGILGEADGKPFVDLPILSPEEYAVLDRICLEYTRLLSDRIEPWLREVLPQLKIDIPQHLLGRVAAFRQYSCYAMPMAFLKKAIADGDFDAGNAVPPMVLVIDDNNR